MHRLLALFLILLLIPAAAHAQRVGQSPDSASSFLAPLGKAHRPAMEQPVQQSAPVAPPKRLLRDRIAAVVNDNVITTSDIEARLRLAFLSSGLPPSQEMAQRLLPQILRSLIDEQLQSQESKHLGITVTKEEIDAALDKIAHDNNITGGMRAYVKSRGASPEALEQQVRGGLTWNKVIVRELRPRVEVGDDEVDAVIDRMRADAGKEEFMVSEIFLSVDNPKDEDQIKQAAENLAQQIKGGANFAAVARQFSQGTGAASGGDIGWIQEGQLPAELNRALMDMPKGGIAGPIRSSSGFHILGLRDKRTIALNGGNAGDVTLDLQQAFRPFENTDRDSALQDAANLRTSINGCTGLQDTLSQKFSAWHWQSMGTVKQTKLPSWLADKLRDTKPGMGSEPITTDKGVLVVFMCDRHVPEGDVDRNAILNSIGTEKMELQARRLMRDLRRSAFLDIRLGNGA